MNEEIQEKKVEEVKTKDLFQLVEVPTQTGIFIKDLENDEILDDKAALLKILNEVAIIKRAVA